MTGNDLIKGALRLIGAAAPGENVPEPDADDARLILNQMIDAWTAEKLLIFTNTRTVFNPLTLVQTYTLGSGGDINITRPVKIDAMSVLSLNNPSTPLELPLQMLTDEEWQAIPVKNVSSSLPQKVWDDGGFPLRTLSLWPIPNVQVNLVLYSWAALSQFTDLVTDFTFPPGYAEALRWNLALRLAPEWGKETASPLIVQMAISSLARIKTINVQERVLSCDPALVSGRVGTYDWRSDR